MTLTDAGEAAEERREAVLERLRQIVEVIESGELPADALVIAIGNGDLGYATWMGAQSWEHLRDLTGLIDDKIASKRWAKSSERSDLTPAQRRKRIKAAYAREQRKRETEKPWLCKCGERYKTDRGAQQHQRIIERHPWSRPGEHRPVTFSPPPDLVPDLKVVS